MRRCPSSFMQCIFVSTRLRRWCPLQFRQIARPRYFDARSASLRAIAPAVDGFQRLAFLRSGMTACAPRSATVVICDNLATHRNKDAAQALKDVGCWFLYLPPYSPVLNPIEMAFSKLKAHLRRIGARTFDQMSDALAEICDLFTPQECWNYFCETGYGSG